MAQSDLLNAVASVFLGVRGLNDDAVYSAGGGNPVGGVKDLPDNIFDGPMPAVVVLSGPKQITPGSWERTKWTVEASVWVPDVPPRGEAYRVLLDVEDGVRQAFREKARAGIPDSPVQAVVITSIDRIGGRQWMRGENQPWALVLPIELEVTVNLATQYRPS